MLVVLGISSGIDRAVFFDLDDALYKEIDFVRSAVTEISLFLRRSAEKLECRKK